MFHASGERQRSRLDRRRGGVPQAPTSKVHFRVRSLNKTKTQTPQKTKTWQSHTQCEQFCLLCGVGHLSNLGLLKFFLFQISCNKHLRCWFDFFPTSSFNRYSTSPPGTRNALFFPYHISIHILFNISLSFHSHTSLECFSSSWFLVVYIFLFQTWLSFISFDFRILFPNCLYGIFFLNFSKAYHSIHFIDWLYQHRNITAESFDISKDPIHFDPNPVVNNRSVSAFFDLQWPLKFSSFGFVICPERLEWQQKRMI